MGPYRAYIPRYVFFFGWTRYNSLYEIIMGIYYELVELIVGINLWDCNGNIQYNGYMSNDMSNNNGTYWQ